MQFTLSLIITSLLPVMTFQLLMLPSNTRPVQQPIALPMMLPKPAQHPHPQMQAFPHPLPYKAQLLPTPAPIIRTNDPNNANPANPVNAETIYADSSNNYAMGGGNYGGGGGNYGGGGGNYGGGGGNYGGGGGNYGGGGGNYGGGGGGNYGGGGGGNYGGGGDNGGGGGGGQEAYGSGGYGYGGISGYGGYNSYGGTGMEQYNDGMISFAPRLSTTIMALGFLAFGAQIADLIMMAINNRREQDTTTARSIYKREISAPGDDIDNVLSSIDASDVCALANKCRNLIGTIKQRLGFDAGHVQQLLNLASKTCQLPFPVCTRRHVLQTDEAESKSELKTTK